MADWHDKMAQWREDQWWLAEEYVRVYQQNISPDQVNRCVAAVARVFNERWIRSKVAHPAYEFLCIQGLSPLHSLVSLGHNLLATEGSQNFRKVLEDLRHPGNFASTRLELALAARLREAGHVVRFRPKLENRRESDFVACLHAEEVFFEVKIVRQSQNEQALTEFTIRLAIAMGDLTRSPGGQFAELHSRIDLDPKVPLVGGPEVDYRVLDGIIKRTTARVIEHLQSGNYEFMVPYVGSFRFGPKNITSQAISRPIPSPIVELGRIMRSCLRKAVRQLPKNQPGLIVIRTEGVLDEAQSRLVVERFLTGEESAAAHVSAVILLPVSYLVPAKWSLFDGFVVENPLAHFPIRSLHAFRVIAETCDLRQDSPAAGKG
jgi:hypothetical protein